MKTLKLKSIFFSLMALMALSVLMISCEQEPMSIIGDDLSGIRPAEAHNSMDVYPADTPESLKKLYVEQYLGTINDRAVIAKLERVFALAFDDIHTVHIQYSEQDGHYYNALGTKDNVEKMEMIKVSAKDAKRGAFSFDETQISDNRAVVGFCRVSFSSHPSACGPICSYQPIAGCFGMMCGYYLSWGYCYEF